MAGQKQQTAKRTTGAVPIGLKKKGGRPSIGGKTSRKTLGTPKASRRKSGAVQGGCLTPKVTAQPTIVLQQAVIPENRADSPYNRRRCLPQGSPLQTRHRCSSRNPPLPALNRPATPETPILPPRKFSITPVQRDRPINGELGSRNRALPASRRRRLPALAEPSHTSAPRSR